MQESLVSKVERLEKELKRAQDLIDHVNSKLGEYDARIDKVLEESTEKVL